MSDRADPGDELYDLPSSEFTTARNALAKRLRSEGRKEDAAIVAKRKRPNRAAEALNRVARQQGDLFRQELIGSRGADCR